MPSQDRVKPDLNEWLGEKSPASSDPAKRSATAVRGMSSQLQRLAHRLGVDPDELASGISDDTIRRSKYPVLEQVNPDGTRTFKHDPQIEHGVKGEIRP
jgi:hypothetical protein